MSYTASELSEFASVVRIIENNLSKPAPDETVYPYELLKHLVMASEEYYTAATASQLAWAMHALGRFAAENGLVIDAYQLAEDLYTYHNHKGAN